MPNPRNGSWSWIAALGWAPGRVLGRGFWFQPGRCVRITLAESPNPLAALRAREPGGMTEPKARPGSGRLGEPGEGCSSGLPSVPLLNP